MPAKRKTSVKSLQSNNLLVIALLLILAFILFVVYGVLKTGKFGQLSLRKDKQESQAATVLPPEEGGSRLPCYFYQRRFEGIRQYYGDADGDGKITSKDALAILKFVSGTYYPNLLYSEPSDVDDTPKRYSILNKTNITSQDAQIVLRYVSGIINNFPACGGQRGLMGTLEDFSGSPF